MRCNESPRRTSRTAPTGAATPLPAAPLRPEQHRHSRSSSMGTRPVSSDRDIARSAGSGRAGVRHAGRWPAARRACEHGRVVSAPFGAPLPTMQQHAHQRLRMHSPSLLAGLLGVHGRACVVSAPTTANRRDGWAHGRARSSCTPLAQARTPPPEHTMLTLCAAAKRRAAWRPDTVTTQRCMMQSGVRAGQSVEARYQKKKNKHKTRCVALRALKPLLSLNRSAVEVHASCSRQTPGPGAAWAAWTYLIT